MKDTGVCSEAAVSVLREVVIDFPTVSLGLKISFFYRNAGIQRLVNNYIRQEEDTTISLYSP